MSAFLKAMGQQECPLEFCQPAEPLGAGNIFTALPELPSPEKTIRMLLEEAMKRSKGNQSMAARLLGMSQPALCKRLKRAEKAALENKDYI